MEGESFAFKLNNEMQKKDNENGENSESYLRYNSDLSITEADTNNLKCITEAETLNCPSVLSGHSFEQIYNVLIKRDDEDFKDKCYIQYMQLEINKLAIAAKALKNENSESAQEIHSTVNNFKEQSFDLKKKLLEANYTIYHLLEEKKRTLLKEGEERKKQYDDKMKLFMANYQKQENLKKQHSPLWLKREECRTEMLCLEVKAKMLQQQLLEQLKRNTQKKDIHKQIRNSSIIEFAKVVTDREKCIKLARDTEVAREEEAKLGEQLERLELVAAHQQIKRRECFTIPNMPQMKSSPFTVRPPIKSYAPLKDPQMFNRIETPVKYTLPDYYKENVTTSRLAKRRFATSFSSELSPANPKFKQMKVNVLHNVIVKHPKETLKTPFADQNIQKTNSSTTSNASAVEVCQLPKIVAQEITTTLDADQQQNCKIQQASTERKDVTMTLTPVATSSPKKITKEVNQIPESEYKSTPSRVENQNIIQEDSQLAKDKLGNETMYHSIVSDDVANSYDIDAASVYSPNGINDFSLEEDISNTDPSAPRLLFESKPQQSTIFNMFGANKNEPKLSSFFSKRMF